MDPKQNTGKKPLAPNSLPVFDDQKVEVRTMQEDLKKARAGGPVQETPRNNETTMDTDFDIKDQLAIEEQPKENIASTTLNNETAINPIPTPKTDKTNERPNLNQVPKPPLLNKQETERPEDRLLKPSPELPNTKKTPSPFDKFRKPIDTASGATNMDRFKNMLPKQQPEQIPKEDPIQKETPEMQKGSDLKMQEIPTDRMQQRPEQDLEIKIPGETSKLPKLMAFIAALVVLFSIFGFIYYWFFIRESTEETPKETTQEQPEVISIPEPQLPDEETVMEKPKEITPPEISEPTTPSSVFYFNQTIVTTIDQPNKINILQNLGNDSLQITGDGTITRHLFKISNQTEKRFLETADILNVLGIKIPQSILSDLSDVEIVSYKIDNLTRFGIMAQIKTSKEMVFEKMKSWEIAAIQDIKQLFMGDPIIVPEDPKFAENQYLDFSKRYFNLSETETSIDYAVSDKYFIIATSKDMMFASILQTQR